MSTILVVEDDDYIRLFLSTNLRARGFNVFPAENLASARQAVEKTKPDTIILDIRLGDGSGLDFARELFAKEGWREIPIIITTASSESFTESEEYPNVVYRLLKPIDVKRLFTAVTSV